MTVSFPRPYFVGKRGFILFHSALMVAVFAATHAITARRDDRPSEPAMTASVSISISASKSGAMT
jgi:hypothetical protein